MGYEENEARSYGLRALYGLCLFSQLNKLPPKGQVFVAKQIQMEKETTVNKTFENRKEVQTILPIEKKYTQDWHKYNLAKCNEKLLFYELLNDLSKLIREKPYRFGRPFIPIKDLFFSVGLKLYSNYSGRKTMSDLKKANDAGYISVKPHFNTLTEFLNCPATYELLSKMLTVSAIPLNKLEDKFSIDSSGFGSYQYERWMRVRFQKDPTGKMSKRGWRNYLKGHILIGTRTNVICSAEITEGNLADVKQLPKLLAHKEDELEKKYKITKELAKELIHNDIFEALIKKFSKIEPMTIAHTLVNIPKEIKTRFKEDISKLKNEDFEEVLDYLSKEMIAKEAIIDLLIKKIKNEKIKLEEFAGVSEQILEKEIKELLDKKKGLNIGAYMGILMGKYRGKVDGKKIMEILKNLLK